MGVPPDTQVSIMVSRLLRRNRNSERATCKRPVEKGSRAGSWVGRGEDRPLAAPEELRDSEGQASRDRPGTGDAQAHADSRRSEVSRDSGAEAEGGALASPYDELAADRLLERLIGRMIDVNYHLIVGAFHRGAIHLFESSGHGLSWSSISPLMVQETPKAQRANDSSQKTGLSAARADSSRNR